ncbi:antichymotrypsin-2-like [Cotesia glomerata]|uniref:Serpin domain-containing protein n=1 Tax=Cotesia glomerata TaxID=32391 RepID=A0AAV7J1S8_COTGL|nr:antichymotrypsin-2-like [Cotesia glomerata]KAH0564629.1 hypothetical protein KQX54_013198 [Cotesia glomerata]
MAIKIMLWIPFIITICTAHYTSGFNFERDENMQAIHDISLGINRFTVELHKIISRNVKSFVISPLSVALVLMMAACGADGENAEEMKSVLHFDSDNSVHRTGIHSMLEMFNAIQTSEVKMANRMYIKKGIKIYPDYVNLIKTTFNSSIENVEFENCAETAQAINQWCAEQTHQRIEKIIDPNDIDQETMLILVNAVYFKALWSSAFEKSDTNLKTFHLNKFETKEVPMMWQSIETSYGVLSESNATFVRLRFKSNYVYEYLNMIVMLPNEIDGLDIIENNLHKLEPSAVKGTRCLVRLFLPKFKMENKFDLTVPLNQMGMVTPFQDNANFSRMSKKPLEMKIAKIVQKTIFEVNEKGVEAVAATQATLNFRFGKGYNPYLKKVDFVVNRPFMYLITNKNTILFSGKVTDPDY